MVRSARGDETVALCSNTPRNPFNEETCKISYHPNACDSVPESGGWGFTLSSLRDLMLVPMLELWSVVLLMK